VTDHIWEIKTRYGKEQFRLLTFIEDNAVIVAAHGFTKKSMDLKKQDLELAKERRKDYLRGKIQKPKPSLSRLENHGEDVRLSTITRYGEATGCALQLNIVPNGQRRSPGRKLSASVEWVSA
jgi:hypothetical protein